MGYMDKVITRWNGKDIYTDTPANVAEVLKNDGPPHKEAYFVLVGQSQEELSIDDYLELRKNYKDPGCSAVSPEEWIGVTFHERCYFYPMRHCPGWVRGTNCSRMRRLVPEEDEEE